MPTQALHDVSIPPPRPVEALFELAGRRLAERWLATGEITADAADLHRALEFLGRVGVAVERGPGVDFRVLSATGITTLVTRQALLVLALRRLVERSAPALRAPASRAA